MIPHTRTLATGVAFSLCLAMGATAASAGTPAGTGVPAPPTVIDTQGEAAKNVIVLIGDGMGHQMVDLASAWQHGTTYHQFTHDPTSGETVYHEGTPSEVYQHFPVQTWQSTYSLSGRAGYDGEAAWGDFDWVKSGATDSAAAGTALATGVKTHNGVLGLDGEGNPVTNLVEVATASGKASGVVSSVPFSHATPSAYAVHTQSRNDFHEIAGQMLGSDLDVIIGAGHPGYDDDSERRDPSYGWISQPDFEAVSTFETRYTYVETGRQFDRLASNKPLTGRDYAPGQGRGEQFPTQLFGLVQVDSTLQQNRSGAHHGVQPFEVPMNAVPTLDTLTLAALNVLDRNESDGFFLMVEGGAIDWAGHASSTPRTIEEQVDFNAAVEAAFDWVEHHSSWEDTLLIVTSDHETGYLAGPGADPTWTELTSAEPGAGHSWHSGNHTNQLVPIYAKGVGAELLLTHTDGVDPVLGDYVDNTTLAQIQMGLISR